MTAENHAHHDVFVCYSSRDKNIADAIVADFEQHGIRCWYASRDVHAGSRTAAIARGIEEACLFVLVYTDVVNKDQHVMSQVGLAFDASKTIVPFRLSEDELSKQLKFYLMNVQWLDAMTDTLAEAIDRLREEVEAILRRVYGRRLKATGYQKIDKTDITEPIEPKVIGEKKIGESDITVKRKVPIKFVCAAVAALMVLVVIIALMCRVGPDPAVGGTLASDVLNNIKSYEDAEDGRSFGTRYSRKQVSSITFRSSMPNDMDEEGWDVSEAHDGSVLAWYRKNSGGLYDLIIAGEGAICAPADCGYLFAGYTNARTMDFGDALKVRSVKNTSHMFYGCSSVVSLDVSGFETSEVSDMGYMFDGCSSVASLDVSRFDTSKSEKTACMFHKCSSLTSLDVSGFDTSNVIGMRMMFSYCSALTSLDVSGFNTSSATDMAGLFEECKSLKDVDVSSFDTSNAKYTEWMFDDCSSLQSIDVSGFDTSKVNKMSYMFHGCTSLKSLDVSAFKTSAVTDVSGTFASCTNLTTLDLTGWDVSQVEKYEKMFKDATNALEVRYPKGGTAWEKLIGQDLGGAPRFVAV